MGAALVLGGASASWAQVDEPVEEVVRVYTGVPLPWAYVPPVNPPRAENPPAFTYVKTPDPLGQAQSLELESYRTVPGPDVGFDPDGDVPTYRKFPDPAGANQSLDEESYETFPDPEGDDQSLDAVTYR